MSDKKFTTEELIQKLANACREAYALGPNETLAIIGKLKAADALCVGAKELTKTTAEAMEKVNLELDRGHYLIDSELAPIRKAIANYEEKQP